MNYIRIVEYGQVYAKDIADMWKKTIGCDDWNGKSDFCVTEESVLKDEEKEHIQTYISLNENNEVVGYCKIMKDYSDENALYITLLSVRPDYYGKKIGKNLVLKALYKTIELGYDKLNLNTWAGNTKALPLYKKCGFFLEDKTDTTSLRNFIPLLHKTELLEEEFKQFDWYEDSQRSLDINPDIIYALGREYYIYKWGRKINKINNDNIDKTFLVEICGTGRGIRKIETDAYSIEASVVQKDLIFGKHYGIKYKIENKTANDFSIHLAGENDKCVKFEFEKEFVVSDSITFEEKFFVEPIHREFEDFEQHPTVRTKIKVNGKKAHLGVGIVPKFPVKINFKKEDGLSYKNVTRSFSLEIENNYDDKIAICLEFPKNEEIVLEKSKVDIDLHKKEKKNIRINYKLVEACIYTPMIKISAQLGDEKVCYEQECDLIFQTLDGICYGECESAYYICNGKYQFKFISKQLLDRDINEAIGKDITCYKGCLWYWMPKLGKPFTSEFMDVKPPVKFIKESNAVTMALKYLSNEYENIELVQYFKLHSNGTIERWFDIKNTGNEIFSREIVIGNDVCVYPNDMTSLIFPYDNKIVSVKEELLNPLTSFDSKKVNENWLFFDGDECKFGYSWDEDLEIKYSDCVLNFEHYIGILNKGETVSTKVLKAYMNTFSHWNLLRNYANKRTLPKNKPHNSIEIQINEGNPFVSNKSKAEVIDLKSEKSITEYKINSNKLPSDIEVVDIQKRVGVLEKAYKKILFNVNQNKLIKEQYIECGQQVLEIDNGVINFKASPTFSPCLYSCIYNQLEWLDTSFPHIKPKSWWKNWSGGMFLCLNDQKMDALFHEECQGEFCEKMDSMGNVWSGIKLSLYVNSNKQWDGMVIEQYFMTMGNIPVISYFAQVDKRDKKEIFEQSFKTNVFIKTDEVIKNCSICFERNQEKYRLYCGGKEVKIDVNSMLEFVGSNRKSKAYYITDNDNTHQSAVVNNEVLRGTVIDKITSINGEVGSIRPQFIIFTEKELKEKWLHELKRIEF